MGSDEMISADGNEGNVWHLRDGEIRLCRMNGTNTWAPDEIKVHCGPWNTEPE